LINTKEFLFNHLGEMMTVFELFSQSGEIVV